MRSTRLLALVVAVAVLAAACGGDDDTGGAAGEGEGDQEAQQIELEPVDDLPEQADGGFGLPDRAITDVPLDQVIFDTFGQGDPISLAEASDEQILGLLDQIPPIDEPVYGGIEEGDWLDPTDVVLGYQSITGQAYAYPHKILNFHEIVNDTIDGVPVLISYCPLCNSGVVYDRELDDLRQDGALTFSNTSALFDNDLVMVDRETSSYWWQVPGRAIVGTLSGAALSPLPSRTMTWQAWQELHPETVILTQDTGFERPYDRDPFVGYAELVERGSTPFPVNPDAMNDQRLSPATQVLGVELGDDARAFAIEQFPGQAHNTAVGGEPVVLFTDPAATTGVVFRRTIGDTTLTFTALPDGAGFVDAETESLWDFAGRGVSGPFEGQMLLEVPSRSTFWFAYVASFPNVIVEVPAAPSE